MPYEAEFDSMEIGDVSDNKDKITGRVDDEIHCTMTDEMVEEEEDLE